MEHLSGLPAGGTRRASLWRVGWSCSTAPASLSAACVGMDQCGFTFLNRVLFYFERGAGSAGPQRRLAGARPSACVGDHLGAGCVGPGKGGSPVGLRHRRAADPWGCPTEQIGADRRLRSIVAALFVRPAVPARSIAGGQRQQAPSRGGRTGAVPGPGVKASGGAARCFCLAVLFLLSGAASRSAALSGAGDQSRGPSLTAESAGAVNARSGAGAAPAWRFPALPMLPAGCSRVPRLPGSRAGGAAPTRRFPAREMLIHQLWCRYMGIIFFFSLSFPQESANFPTLFVSAKEVLMPRMK